MREPGQSCCRPCREAQGPVQARATRGLFLSVAAGCRMRRQRRSPDPWESTVQPPRSTVNAVQRGTWMQRVCRGGARGRLPGGEGFAMTLTDQWGVARRKGCECECVRLGDEVAWEAAPVPGSAPSPKSHSSLQPSSLLRPSQPKIPNPPPSSPASRTRGPRLLPPPPCLRLAPQSARSTCRWQKLLSLKSPVINHLIAKPNYSQSSNKPRTDRPPGH